MRGGASRRGARGPTGVECPMDSPSRTQPETLRAVPIAADAPRRRLAWAESLASVMEPIAHREVGQVAASDTALTDWARQRGLDDERQLAALAASLGIAWVEGLAEYRPWDEYSARVPIAFARQHRVLLVQRSDDAATIYAAVCDWQGLDQVDTLARWLARPLTPLATTPGAILGGINAAYQERSGAAQQLIDSLDAGDVLTELQALEGREDLLDTTGRAPVIKLVNALLFEAVKAGASDVHVQPYEDRVVARLRIDGILFDAYTIPKPLQEEVLTRIKVLGRMNIAEKRLPQDGRATVQVGDRQIDLRIASLPTSNQERIVIRLLDRGARLYTLGELGMPPGVLERFRRLIQLDHGLILVTGPTGSGKSTTLYAALQEINTKDQNVLTLEDPIEYQLDGVSQTQINEKKGMTFASGLRSVLRQDPDIIMVGEIRDQETAVMAIQASLTGHLVFSTLHTNDASSAVTRLLDLGIEPYLVASSLVASLAQRLVRRVCRECRAPVDDLAARPAAAAAGREVYVGRGCPKCRGTGYRGRLGVFEMLVVDGRIRELIQQRSNAAAIRDAALAGGMTLLEDDGLAKVAAGETTYAEVLRVARSALEEF